MILTNEEIMQINQTAEFDSALGYARKIEQAVLESYKAELLKEAGDPVLYAEFAEDGGWLGDASEYQDHLEEPHALYTSDQVAAAIGKLRDQLTKAEQLWQVAQGRCDGLEEKLAKAEQRVAEYNELIYAVQTKHHDETRHQTALRYIRNAENRQSNTTAAGASS